MKRKILLFIGMLSLLILVSVSVSSCGFSSSDALEIENITLEDLADGSMRLTITYFDNVEPPVVVEIPTGDQGEKGEKGDSGNGIARIDIQNSEDGTQQTLRVVYTDPAHTPDEFVVKNGSSITSAERVDKEDGKSYLALKLSNGDTHEIELPEGVPGAGIQTFTQMADPENPDDIIVKFKLDNGTELASSLRIKPGKGINAVEERAWYDELTGEEKGKILYFFLDGANSENLDEAIAHVKIPGAVGVGNVQQEEILNDAGKKIGTRFRVEKTDGTTTDWIDIKDGVQIEDFATERQADGSTKVTVTMSDGTTKEFNIPAVLGISRIEPLYEDGSITLLIHMTDGTIVEVGMDEPVGISNISIENSSDGSKYLMTVYYSNNTSETIEFAKPTAWYSGVTMPSSDLGNDGDYYFDEASFEIWHKQGGVWEKVMDFYDFGETARVTFSVDRNAGEWWPEASGISRPTYTVLLTVGDAFAFHSSEAGYSIPIPVKTPTDEEIANGVLAWEFVGWSTQRSPNPTNGYFTDLTMITGDITLVPVWKALS